MNFSSSVMTGMGISLGGLEIATDFLYANSDMYEPELTEVKATISHKVCRPVTRVKPVRPKTSTQNIVNKFTLVPANKQNKTLNSTCDEIIDDTLGMVEQSDDFDFSFDDIKEERIIHQEEVEKQEENAALANNLLSRIQSNKQPSKNYMDDTELEDFDINEIDDTEEDELGLDDIGIEDSDEDEFGLDELNEEQDNDEEDDYSFDLEEDDSFNIDEDEDDDDDDDDDGIEFDIGDNDEDVEPTTQKSEPPKQVEIKSEQPKIQPKPNIINNIEDDEPTTQKSEPPKQVEIKSEQPKIQPKPNIINNIEDDEDDIEFDLGDEEDTNEEIDDIEEDGDIEFDLGEDDIDDEDEVDLEEIKSPAPQEKPKQINNVIEQSNNTNTQQKVKSVAKEIKEEQVPSAKELQMMEQIKQLEAQVQRLSTNNTPKQNPEHEFMERIKQLEAQIQNLSGVSTSEPASSVENKSIKKDSNLKIPSSKTVKTIEKPRNNQKDSQENSTVTEHDRYSAMQIDALYKEVRKFAIELGVKQKPVDISKLEDKFGAMNIRKLVNKSYIIKIGKGATIGR